MNTAAAVIARAPPASRRRRRRARRRARARPARARSMPPGEVTERRTASVSMSRACSSAAVPARFAATSSPATSAGSPARTPASTCASAISAMYAGAQLMRPIATSICALVDGHDGADALEQLDRLRCQLGCRLRVAGVAGDALAHLDGHARASSARPACRRRPRAARATGTPPRIEMMPLAAPPSVGRDALEARRLVAQHDDVRARGELGGILGDLAAELLDERLGARAVEVVDEHADRPSRAPARRPCCLLR